jgi:hypothetical protein
MFSLVAARPPWFNVVHCSEYLCPGPTLAPCNMNGLCYFDPKAAARDVQLAANCSCGQAFRVIHPSCAASDKA